MRFNCWLGQCENNFIAGRANTETILAHTESARKFFKIRISLPNRMFFSKILCYRPLGPYEFGFCEKTEKISYACIPLSGQLREPPKN
jgi:hypothetical protein